MIRKIIVIDEEKCDGCGLCVTACDEGAIGLVNGKAVLLRDDYCDGLGNCLPACPAGAIDFEEREALPFNEEEVKRNIAMQKKEQENHAACDSGAKEHGTLACGCPGSHAKMIQREEAVQPPVSAGAQPVSQLAQWPVQIKLVPVNAPYFNDANLLVAADCAAYACGNFHNDFMQKKITIIGCPKLDDEDYSEKLTAIIKANNIKSVTIVRMEVPCCYGLEVAVRTALENSGKTIPWQLAVLTTDGNLLD